MWQVLQLQTQGPTGKSPSGNPPHSCKGEPGAANSLWRMRNSPSLERSRSLLLKRGKAAAGRRVDWLAVSCLSEGSRPELLLTSQVRETWDPLLWVEARCSSPFLLAGNQQKGERAKQLTRDQQGLLAPTTSYRHCASYCFTLQLVNLQYLTVASLRDRISALYVAAACTELLQALRKQPFALKKKVSLVNHCLPSALSTA